jgi:hypothetical protein
MPFTSMLSFVKNNGLACGAIWERLGWVYKKRGKLSSGKCDGWLTANKICKSDSFGICIDWQSHCILLELAAWYGWFFPIHDGINSFQ